MQRGGGAPSKDGDPTAKSLIGRRSLRVAMRVASPEGSLLRRIRRHGGTPGIDGKAIGACRRLVMDDFARNVIEAAIP